MVNIKVEMEEVNLHKTFILKDFSKGRTKAECVALHLTSLPESDLDIKHCTNCSKKGAMNR